MKMARNILSLPGFKPKAGAMKKIIFIHLFMMKNYYPSRVKRRLSFENVGVSEAGEFIGNSVSTLTVKRGFYLSMAWAISASIAVTWVQGLDETSDHANIRKI